MGVDPLELPLRRFVSLAYFIRVRNLNEAKRDKHDNELYRPPPQYAKREREETMRKGFEPAEEMNAFMTLARQTATVE